MATIVYKRLDIIITNDACGRSGVVGIRTCWGWLMQFLGEMLIWLYIHEYNYAKSTFFILSLSFISMPMLTPSKLSMVVWGRRRNVVGSCIMYSHVLMDGKRSSMGPMVLCFYRNGQGLGPNPRLFLKLGFRGIVWDRFDCEYMLFYDSVSEWNETVDIETWLTRGY